MQVGNIKISRTAMNNVYCSDLNINRHTNLHTLTLIYMQVTICGYVCTRKFSVQKSAAINDQSTFRCIWCGHNNAIRCHKVGKVKCDKETPKTLSKRNWSISHINICATTMWSVFGMPTQKRVCETL